MDKNNLLKSLSLLRLKMEKISRRKSMVSILQEEWNSISSFLDDFEEENWSDLDEISKKKKSLEEEVTSLEKQVVSLLGEIDIHQLEMLISKEEDTDSVVEVETASEA
jgi:hypothetical protein